jgi:hypothetical protein
MFELRWGGLIGDILDRIVGAVSMAVNAVAASKVHGRKERSALSDPVSMAVSAVAASKGDPGHRLGVHFHLVSMAVTAVAASKVSGRYNDVFDPVGVSMAVTAVAASKGRMARFT